MFIAKIPAHLSFRLDAFGALLKEQGGWLSRGEAQRLELAGLSEFADLLRTLTPKNALSYGVSDHESAIVVRQGALEWARQWEWEHPVIARTRKAFRWPQGPGIMMVDYDPAAEEEPYGGGFAQSAFLVFVVVHFIVAGVATVVAALATKSMKRHIRGGKICLGSIVAAAVTGILSYLNTWGLLPSEGGHATARCCLPGRGSERPRVSSRGPDDRAPSKSTPRTATRNPTHPPNEPTTLPATYPPPRKARKVAPEAVVVPTINPTSVGRPSSL
jgi:hypothetical protein